MRLLANILVMSILPCIFGICTAEALEHTERNQFPNKAEQIAGFKIKGTRCLIKNGIGRANIAQPKRHKRQHSNHSILFPFYPCAVILWMFTFVLLFKRLLASSCSMMKAALFSMFMMFITGFCCESPEITVLLLLLAPAILGCSRNRKLMPVKQV